MDEAVGRAVSVRAVLMDLGGVVYVGDSPLPGAREAIVELRQAGVPLRFITNTTRRCRRQVIGDLAEMGLSVTEEELLTPAVMARAYLEAQRRSPLLIVHPGLEEDFDGVPRDLAPAVVVGDAGEHFTYERLNAGYRAIEAGAPLLALAMNRNFKDADGALSLDAGPFVAALEYASRRKAVVLGKPSPDFYRMAMEGTGYGANEIVMVGDDVESDVIGAIAAGLYGILVRTGKYRPGDEKGIDEDDGHAADTLADAVQWILRHRQT